jgi:uncharacterized phage protein (TIGR02218 family)
MSYVAREQSAHAGHPLELYRFALGDQQWLYTSADHEVAYGADLYQPVYIRRGGFTRGGDARKSTIEIEVSAVNDVTLLFRSGWLAGLLVVTIYRHHHGDSDYSVLWKGRVTGCKWAGSTATLTSDSVFTLFQRAGLRRVYQVGCPHVLFGAACGLDASAWAHAELVTSVNVNQVVMAGAGDLGAGYFTGGMLRLGDEYRLIVGQSGDALTLLDRIPGLAAGMEAIAWPGCSRSTATCAGKFNNIDNYGGLPFLPSKNPFSGDALV